MSKLLTIGVCIIIAVGIAGALSYSMHQDRNPNQTQQSEKAGTGNISVGANGLSKIIVYTDAGFSPSTVTIAAGTTVTWSNQSSKKLWIEDVGGDYGCPPIAASDYSECESISNGGTYSSSAFEPFTYTYRNHENVADTGTIIVTDASSAGPINPEAIPE